VKLKVRDVMTTRVVTISPDTPLKEAAVEMTDHRVSGLPVVEDGKLVGIVTESDFVSRLAGEGDGLMALAFGRRNRELGGAVRDAMTARPHTVGPDESVTAAARVMAEKRVKRLPVVDSSGAIVGIVSRADLMSIFARSDDLIASDIVNEGVVGLLGADPDALDVSVDSGVVTLSGTVDSVTEKRMLEEFARRVAGVVSVESRLEASFDDTRLPPI
jgi:CBS domain-containing protein